jgi:hypothetical protein
LLTRSAVVGLALGLLVGSPTSIFLSLQLRRIWRGGSQGESWSATLSRAIRLLSALPALWLGVPWIASLLLRDVKLLLPWYLAGILLVALPALFPFFVLLVAQATRDPVKSPRSDGTTDRPK